MKRYFFTALIIFFGCASVDASQHHSQDGFKYGMKDGMKRGLPNGLKNGDLRDARGPFRGEHPSGAFEGGDESFREKSPAEWKGGRRHGHHHGKHFEDGKRGRPDFHPGERPEGRPPFDMKGEGQRGHPDFRSRKRQNRRSLMRMRRIGYHPNFGHEESGSSQREFK